MANVSAVTNHFPTAKEGFVTTAASSIGSGAATVPLNSVTGYANGDIAVMVIEPADTDNKQVFTGVVDTAGVQLTGVKWTEGTNTTHAAGSTVVDYVTATHQSMMTKGLKVEHKQSGAHSDVTADSLVVAGLTTTDDLTVTDTFTYKGLSLGLGWMNATGTWTYSAYNSTTRTGVITVPAGGSALYTEGMRVRFSQTTGSTKHGIIVDVASDTVLHVFFESGKTLANETITSPVYSMLDIPFGFPRTPTSWQLTGGSDGSQATPGAGTWYNIGGSLALSRGSWLLGYKTALYGARAAGSTAETGVTLSTTNNGQTDSTFTYQHRLTGVGTTTTELRVPAWREKYVDLTADTTYYLNGNNDTGGASSSIHVQGTSITATCGYL